MSHYSNNSFLSTPNRSSFRRYSLADTSISAGLLSTPSTLNRSHYAAVKTKIDTVSPGYSSRVVQYNEEKEKSSPKPKYDKIGVFPIVHFFKKDQPPLHRKNDSSSDLNSSDLTKFNTPEHNRMLLEKIIKSNLNSPNLSPPKSETNAKSVLEALKEISRKRINPSGEEFIMKDDGKRMLDHDIDSARKRIKQNDDSKKPCIDEITASNLSMDMYLRDLYLQEQAAKRAKLKRRQASQLTPPKILAKTKSISVETQTPPPPPSEPPKQSEPKEEETKKEEKKEEFVPAIKIFDDGPLEAMRRNRLRVLMGPVKFLDEVEEKTESPQKEEASKPLVSILSTPNKSPQKSTKHVTFDVPETTVSFPINNTSPVTNNVVTKTSAAISMPIVSASVVASKLAPFGFRREGHIAVIPQISGPPILLGTCTMVTAGTPMPPLPPFPPPVTTQSKIEDRKNEKTTTEGSTLSGGFKFDLKQPEAQKTTTGFTPPTNSFTPQQKPTPTFGFGSNVEQKSDKSFPGAFSLEKGQTGTNSTLLGFGATADQKSDKSFPNAFSMEKSQTTANPLNFTNTAVTSSFGTKETTPSFSFGSNLKTFTLPPATVASTASGGFSFNPPTTSATFGTKPTTTPNFASNATEAKPPPNAFFFGSTNKTQEQSTTGFGVATTTSSAGFGVATTTTFGTPSTTSSVGFGVATTTSFGTPSNSVPSFGINSANPPPAFGTNTNVPSFGTANTNNVPSFGANSFGTSSSLPAFGAQANSTKIVPPFGTPSNTSLPSFGATTTNSSSSFGAPSSVNTTSAFGTPTTSTSTMSFATASGSNTSIGFGAKPGFGQNGSFGGNATAFGTGATTKFGTTKTNNVFGNSSTVTAFNSSSTGFGSTAAPSFGSAQNQSAPPPFGQTQSTQPFGVTTTASGFGTNAAPTSSTPFASSFGTASGSSETPFGGGSSGFGSGSTSTSTSTSSFGQAANFNFAPNSGPSKPGVFAFGSTEPPKPNFNFQGGGNAQAFGTGAVVGFGTPFSAQQPPPGGMFNIGVGGSSTPARPRTVYKAKRRT